MGYLFNMTDDTVFDTTFAGFAKIITHNIPRGYILDNRPLQSNLENQLKKYAHL
jgi:hypothetical protein